MSNERVSPGLLPRISGPEGFGAAFGVSRETLERLEAYAGLLVRWQKTINLVAPSTLPDLWHRHFADSAQLLALAPSARNWVDLGSGAGFPGLVLAILLAERGGARVVLAESDTRKCAFLAEVVRGTGLGGSITVEIAKQRIETLSIQGSLATQGTFAGAEVVTARALAPLSRLFVLAQPLMGPTSVALFLKGRDAETEIGDARRNWQFDCRLNASRTDSSGQIVEVRGLEAKTEGQSP